MAILTFNTYGKSAVRLTQLLRDGQWHQVVDIAIQVLFQGDFDSSYTEGDNSSVLPTDTIKNTVYVLARQNPIRSIEEFASLIAAHFLSRLHHLHKVTVSIEQTPWSHIDSYQSAFLQPGTERRTTTLIATRFSETFVSGMRDIEILKTGKSAFAGFLKDEFTTLPETDDRLLGTVLQAEWTYRIGIADFNRAHTSIRQTLLNAFANHDSLSVQQTLYAMGEAVLDEFHNIEQIHLSMPNKHRLLVDLSKFALDNPNQLFVPTDEPSGYIEAHLAAPAR